MKFKYIVLIDDDDAVNYYHQYVLENMNCTENILIGRNIEDAVSILMTVQKINDVNPSLVILDVNMPKYNGFEFVTKYYEVFQELKRRNVMIIFLTTSNNPQDIEKANELEVVSDYKQKPMTEEMIKELQDMLGVK